MWTRGPRASMDACRRPKVRKVIHLDSVQLASASLSRSVRLAGKIDAICGGPRAPGQWPNLGNHIHSIRRPAYPASSKDVGSVRCCIDGGGHDNGPGAHGVGVGGGRCGCSGGRALRCRVGVSSIRCVYDQVVVVVQADAEVFIHHIGCETGLLGPVPSCGSVQQQRAVLGTPVHDPMPGCRHGWSNPSLRVVRQNPEPLAACIESTGESTEHATRAHGNRPIVILTFWVK